MKKPKQLVVVMAKVPEAGRVKTRLVSKRFLPENAATLATAFLVDTLTELQNPALAAQVVLALDAPTNALPDVALDIPLLLQKGETLGERLQTVFQENFAAGFERIIIVGSDTPHLPVAFVQEAFGRLKAGVDAVFGPTDDGGYYLVGLSTPHDMLFDGISWSTGTVLQETLTKAGNAGITTALLPPLYDIDTPDDLTKLRQDIRRNAVHCPATAQWIAEHDHVFVDGNE